MELDVFKKISNNFKQVKEDVNTSTDLHEDGFQALKNNSTAFITAFAVELQAKQNHVYEQFGSEDFIYKNPNLIEKAVEMTSEEIKEEHDVNLDYEPEKIKYYVNYLGQNKTEAMASVFTIYNSEGAKIEMGTPQYDEILKKFFSKLQEVYSDLDELYESECINDSPELDMNLSEKELTESVGMSSTDQKETGEDKIDMSTVKTEKELNPDVM